MKNRIQVRNRRPWTLLSFPKHNTSLLYNNETKKYDFYTGVPEEKKEFKLREMTEPDHIKQEDLRHWRSVCWFLAGSLGTSIAVILMILLTR